MSDSGGENKGTAADVSASQHVMVCALKELGSLVQSLSATAAPLIQEPSIGKKETEYRDTALSQAGNPAAVIHRITSDVRLAGFPHCLGSRHDSSFIREV